MMFMRNSENKALIIAVLSVLVVLGAGLLIFGSSAGNKVSAPTVDHKNIEYVIDGERVQLTNGVSEIEAAPGSASKITVRYFGNELRTDLNNDGREDIVFLLTEESGGSGAFFYVVAALKTDDGYLGSDGYLLGDRIAPQTTELSQDPNQKNVVVVNYADRAPGEPMTAKPSVGKSAYLKLDPVTMRWGVVLSPEARQSL